MLRGVPLVVQTTCRDGLSFDAFSLCQYRLSAAEINISWRQVFQALMVSLMVIVIDERLDLPFKIAGEEVVLQ